MLLLPETYKILLTSSLPDIYFHLRGKCCENCVYTIMKTWRDTYSCKVHRKSKCCIAVHQLTSLCQSGSYWSVVQKSICNSANCQLPTEECAGSTDWPIFGRGPQHQIVIHSPEIKTDSLAVCLSGIFNVTDRWVITVSQSWQAVEMKKKKKWRCGTRGWTRGEEARRRLSASCCRRVTGKMKWKWILHLVILFSYPVTEHFAAKIIFSSVFLSQNGITLPHFLGDILLFVAVTSHISRCTFPDVPPVKHFQFPLSMTWNSERGEKYLILPLSFSFICSCSEFMFKVWHVGI